MLGLWQDMKKDSIYLDYASATPVDERVKLAMLPFYSETFFNASAIYGGGLSAKDALNSSRQAIAQGIGARPAEIVFTSGGSESNNLAIQGVMSNFKNANLLISKIEHDSIIEPAKNYQSKLVKVNSKGLIDLKDLEQKINQHTVLVSIQLANNEIGTIQPFKQIAELIVKVRKDRQKSGNSLPIYLHSDACQAVNYLDINSSRLGVDLLSINGGKIYGPKGSGALFVRAGTSIKPIIYGGGQEFGLRSGTENIAGIVGLAKAFDIAQNTRAEESKRLTQLSQHFHKSIFKYFPITSLNGPIKNRLPNNINLTFKGIDNERLIMRLDMMGVYCSAGSACSASSGVPSHVLRAIGLSDELARSSVRFSFGRQTTEEHIDKAIKIIVQAVRLEQ
jgi:cysteine desulfurase